MDIPVRIQLTGTEKHGDMLIIAVQPTDAPADHVRTLMEGGAIRRAKSRQGGDVVVNWSHVALVEIDP